MSDATPISGRIVRLIDDHTAILNVGSDNGVAGNMRFLIYTPVEEIVDPETNESLGTYRRRKGVLVVDEIAPKFCVASAPVVREELVEEVPYLGFGRTRRRTVTKRNLNVDSAQVRAMPTGDDVRVGDIVEQLVR
jgi:hypothetical protein